MKVDADVFLKKTFRSEVRRTGARRPLSVEWNSV